METKDQSDYYRGRIKEMLRRVPDSVNGGSYETAVAFKKLAMQALKIVNAPRTKLDALIAAHNQLKAYY